MKNRDIKELVLLEVIRRTKIEIPYPVSENWGYLEDLVAGMEQEGMLSVDSNHYRVTTKGKKILLLFRSDVAEMVEPVSKFRSIVLDGKTLDARMPMMAYVASMHHESAYDVLRAGVFGVYWEELIDAVIKLMALDVIWQKVLISDELYSDIENKVNTEAWRELAPDSIEARRIGKWLLNPNQLQTVL